MSYKAYLIKQALSGKVPGIYASAGRDALVGAGINAATFGGLTGLAGLIWPFEGESRLVSALKGLLAGAVVGTGIGAGRGAMLGIENASNIRTTMKKELDAIHNLRRTGQKIDAKYDAEVYRELRPDRIRRISGGMSGELQDLLKGES